MRAFVTESVNQFAVRDDVEVVGPGSNEVRVQIMAAGVCRTDLSAVNGTWPTKLPCVNGHEGAGVIAEVGVGVTTAAVGQHVILSSPWCGRCYYCTHGSPWFCVTKDLGGARAKFRFADGTPVQSMVGKGTWAQETVVAASGVTVIPDSIPFDVASVIGCAVMTGTGQVINVAQPEPGATAIFVGGGGIGACAVMGAKLAGCGLIVVVEPAEPKHDALRRFGATHVIAPDEVRDTIRELTGGRGFDYAFENVGRAETIRTAWDATRLGGTVVVTGLGGRAGKMEFDLQELAVQGKRLLGNNAGGVVSERDFPRYCELYELGKLDLDALITRRLTLDDLPDALHALDHDPTVQRQVVQFA